MLIFIQKTIHPIILILVLFAFTTTTLSQKNTITPRLEKQILKGLDEVYKFNFKKSEKIFNEVINVIPENPAGYHFKSIQYLWRYLDNKNDTDFVKFISLSDTVIEIVNDSFESNLSKAVINFVLGSTYSFRAMAFTRQENYLDAVWAAKKSFSYLNTAILIDSTFYDAYMGLGLFNFMIAQTPPALKWAMRITGISGDKDKGIKYLKLAANKGKFSKVDAQYYLSQILAEFYDDNKAAEKLLKDLNKTYPKNILFKYSLAVLYIKMKQLKNAENVLNKIILSKDTYFPQLIRYSKLSLGNIYYYRNEFEKAKSYYKSFIADSTEEYYRGIATLRLGLCYSFAGDNSDAEDYFALTDEGSLDIDDDRYAKYAGEKYLEKPPDLIRLKIEFIKNLIESGSYKKAKDSLLFFEKYKTPGPVLAEINLLRSNASYYLDSLTQSYSYALSVIGNNKAETWMKPFAYYYAARVSLNLNYLSDVAMYIAEAREYSDYIYENKLTNLLNVLENKLPKTKNK